MESCLSGLAGRLLAREVDRVNNPRQWIFRLRTLAPAVTGLAIVALVHGGVRGAATSKQLSTNYTLVNFGSNPATVSVAYLKDDGSPWPVASGSNAFTVAANFGMVQIR